MFGAREQVGRGLQLDDLALAHDGDAVADLGGDTQVVGDEQHRQADARKTIEAFAPGALVVALGLDASEHDPLEGMSITTDGFKRIGAAIAQIGLPTVIVQEGGDLSDVLGDNLTVFLGGFEGAR